MMGRKEIFEYLMRNDEGFRRRVVNTAAAYSLSLYRAATESASERKATFRQDAIQKSFEMTAEPPAAEPSRPRRRVASAQKRAAKIKWAAARRMSPEKRKQALQNNIMVRKGILKALKKGPAKFGEIFERMNEDTKATVNNRKHLSNMMEFLKKEKLIKRHKGQGNQNVLWGLAK